MKPRFARCLLPVLLGGALAGPAVADSGRVAGSEGFVPATVHPAEPAAPAGSAGDEKMREILVAAAARHAISLREEIGTLRAEAERGDAEAQYRLADALRRGIGSDADLVAAHNWFRASAGQDHMAAQLELGYDYLEGHGTPADPREAARWFRLAAERGNAYAQYELAVLLASGTGIARDLDEARHWALRAASAPEPGILDLARSLLLEMDGATAQGRTAAAGEAARPWWRPFLP